MISSIPGLRILIATSVPSWSSAKWTWAIEAEATGVRSKRLNTSSTGRPYSASRRAIACSVGKGGTLSLEFGQLLGQIGRKQVAACREHLTELDEDRPQRFERAPHPDRARLGEVPARDDAAQPFHPGESSMPCPGSSGRGRSAARRGRSWRDGAGARAWEWSRNSVTATVPENGWLDRCPGVLAGRVILSRLKRQPPLT